MENQPQESRYTGKLNEALTQLVVPKYLKKDPKAFYDKVEKLKVVAKNFGCTLPQLAIAWNIVNKDSTVTLFGASKP